MLVRLPERTHLAVKHKDSGAGGCKQVRHTVGPTGLATAWDSGVWELGFPTPSVFRLPPTQVDCGTCSQPALDIWDNVGVGGYPKLNIRAVRVGLGTSTLCSRMISCHYF